MLVICKSKVYGDENPAYCAWLGAVGTAIPSIYCSSTQSQLMDYPIDVT
jgi:hypothetical protein